MKMTFTKVALATVIAGTTLFGGVASATTKDETKATDRYTALKTGMTIEQAAKVIYGKDYKKQLTKKNGSTIFKKKENMTTTSQGRKVKGYSFLNDNTYLNNTALTFMTKKKESLYRLTNKGLSLTRYDSKSGYRESKMKLTKGSKIKLGMTVKQLDNILSGKGLGEWTSLYNVDWTSVQTKQELDLGLMVKGSMKTYVFPTANGKRKMVILSYDIDKKQYIVDVETTL
ncbi:hypothetical protein [Exiguobacterium sp. Leaf196]|jgi:hypothetical protein|uniref:hypothetical protein n=1 Tax=Exiguobacterium sp. Leaf196 TaxID=1736298 RepID=UPI000700ED91|nr:hypothetical protein [Exiguobacterium sp. Leaf196]KQS37473.1 hypothetical protein ASG02_13140 [Exiguobacterium sp. Leaf196]